MTGQNLSIGIKNQYNLGDGLYEFLSTIVAKAQQWGENFATVTQKTKLAEEVNKDPRTITRYINELKDAGLISTEVKKGRNGGTVIMFNKDLLNFEPSENPITSETKEADEIRNKLFPRKPKKEPTKRYRSKKEIAEERILAQLRKSENDKLNDELETMLYPTTEFFNKFDDPDRYLGAYLISRMFNAYAVIFPKNRMEFFKDSNDLLHSRAESALIQAHSYDVLDTRFVGTTRFQKFLELQDYVKENEINPLAYLSVQFDYVDFMIEIGKLTHGVPLVNTLLTDDSKGRFINQEQFYTRMRRKGLFSISPEKVYYIGAKYPIIQDLSFAYDLGERDASSLDPILDELNTVSRYTNKGRALLGFYEAVSQEVEESTIGTEDKAVITQFLREQVALYSRVNSLNIGQYTLAFPLQITRVKQTVEMKGLDINDYYTYVGNMYKQDSGLFQSDIEDFIKTGKLIDFSMNGNKTFYPTLRFLAEYRGLGVNPHELKEALGRFGLEKVPLDNFGMLDVARIYKKVLTGKELAEDASQFENVKFY